MYIEYRHVRMQTQINDTDQIIKWNNGYDNNKNNTINDNDIYRNKPTHPQLFTKYLRQTLVFL